MYYAIVGKYTGSIISVTTESGVFLDPSLDGESFIEISQEEYESFGNWSDEKYVEISRRQRYSIRLLA